MHKMNGFSLPSVIMGITLTGVLAGLAKPSVDAFLARMAQKEARNTLLELQAAQRTHMINDGSLYAFDKFGYVGAGSYNCDGSASPTDGGFGYRPLGCKSMNYSYEAWVNPVGYSGSGSATDNLGDSYEIIAHAPSDVTNRIYFGCDGKGSSVYGYDTGDVWRIRTGSPPELCRDVVLACNDKNPDTGRCKDSQKLAKSYEWKLAGSGSGGSGGDSSGDNYVVKLVYYDVTKRYTRQWGTRSDGTQFKSKSSGYKLAFVRQGVTPPSTVPPAPAATPNPSKTIYSGQTWYTYSSYWCASGAAHVLSRPKGEPCSNMCYYIGNSNIRWSFMPKQCQTIWKHNTKTCEVHLRLFDTSWGSTSMCGYSGIVEH